MGTFIFPDSSCSDKGLSAKGSAIASGQREPNSDIQKWPKVATEWVGGVMARNGAHISETKNTWFINLVNIPATTRFPFRA